MHMKGRARCAKPKKIKQRNIVYNDCVLRFNKETKFSNGYERLRQV